MPTTKWWELWSPNWRSWYIWDNIWMWLIFWAPSPRTLPNVSHGTATIFVLTNSWRQFYRWLIMSLEYVNTCHVRNKKWCLSLVNRYTLLIAGELMVIVEYCRYGNVQNFLLRNRKRFINQINPETDKIDPLIMTQRFSDNFELNRYVFCRYIRYPTI